MTKNRWHSLSSRRFLMWALALCGWLSITHIGCETKVTPTENTVDASTADASTQEAPDTIAQEAPDRAQEAQPETTAEAAVEATPDPAPLIDYPLDDSLRLNHIQTKGTHNSYHVDPGQGVDEWRYSHQPLDVQLDKQGVRQFELDVNWNKELEAFLVYHIPILDQKSTCHRFTDCLQVIKGWSDIHRQHLPIFVFIEPKSLLQKPPEEAFVALEKEALSVFPKERILAPGDLLGSYPNLKEAVAKEGWPTLKQVRGKIVFVLLMGGTQREIYTHGDKDLEGRIMFVTADVGSPYGAVVKLDDPVADEEKIKQAIGQGIIVRTRADAGLEGVKTDDRKRQEAALRSGAHFLSTDYPGKVDGIPYTMEIPGGTIARCNPITAPANCTAAALEE